MKFAATALAILNFGAASASTTLQAGYSNNDNGNVDDNHRRHLQLPKDMECVLYLKLIQFVDGHDERSWSCEFTPEQAAALYGGDGVVDMMMAIDGITSENIEAGGAVSGETIMQAKSAYVVADKFDSMIDADSIHSGPKKNVLHISQNSEYKVEKMDPETDVRHAHNRRARRQRHRNLADSSPGTLNVLVVRPIDPNGAQISANAIRLKDDIFTDAVCLKTQYAACSHDQLIMKQADEFSTTIGNTKVDGIVDINIGVSVSSGREAIEQAAYKEATIRFGGGSSLSSTFDLVIFCQPPGSGDWIAYAYLNTWHSYYNDVGCQRVGVQMHEVGHNLNLGHSGRPTTGNPTNDKFAEYADKSGMMGNGSDRNNLDDGPKHCFNAAKSYQLGWYDRQTKSIDPLSFGGNTQTYVMNGVADYKKDGPLNGELVSLRLEHEGIYGGVDYYIGYNRATGANSGTYDVPNTVTLLEKDNGPSNYGKSRRLAAMTAGQGVTFSNYGGSQDDVFLRVVSINGKDATITISTNNPLLQKCDGSSLQVTLQTDDSGHETAWKLTDDTTGVVVQQSVRVYESETKYEDSFCLPGGCYTFLITDSYGDGIVEPGYFRGYLDGNPTPIFDAGQFDSSYTREFCVGSSPTESPQEQCVDNKDFRWNGQRRKKCKWAGKGKKMKKIRKKCRKKQEGIRVWDWCPKSCAKAGKGPCAVATS